ncbi:MAG: sigma 54-interacting transcriptional regulator [Deltaproteobacteria bacterium]|nr:sigma 54-interacting transcriptional regulator [Deltaproteobacteria bacterium]
MRESDAQAAPETTQQHTQSALFSQTAGGEPLVYEITVRSVETSQELHRVRLDASQPGRCLVGSSLACNIRVEDPTVSRRHLALEVRDGALVVTDLESRNGTRIAGLRVREALVEERAIIEIGSVRIEAVKQTKIPAATLPPDVEFGNVVGASLQMRRLYPLCHKLAHSTIPVVIEGETGTGKEAMAEALHSQGPRANAPFVVFDCTAITASLLEAELFGHEKGAFTGADRAREGVFAQADGGTLFIDEIGDMDLALQAKLLRAIDRNEVRPIGGAKPLKLDVRIIAATRRDLDREVQTGRFRDDLFHRLAIGRIELPPLRRRTGDVALLAKRFWQDFGGQAQGLPMSVLSRWESDPWTGNVRELRNAVARYLALGELAELTTRHAPEEEPRDDKLFAGLEALPLAQARAVIVERFERVYINRVLGRVNGNVTKAAAHAGVARRYFHILKSKLGGSEG